MYIDPNKFDNDVVLGNTEIPCIIATNSKFDISGKGLRHAFQRAWQRGISTDTIYDMIMSAGENIYNLACENDEIEEEKDEKTLLIKSLGAQTSVVLSATWDRDGNEIFINLITVVSGFKGSTRYPHQVECWVG